MLTHRGRRILFALVSEFIATGEPVSSGALGRGHGIELSSASIRAVFQELEAHGYLHKPHASAGRVPTEKGLRAFVDALIAATESPAELRDRIEDCYAGVGPGVDEMMRRTGKVLAQITGSASVVIAAPAQGRVVRDLRFISLRADEVLAVTVMADGSVQNRVVRTEQTLSPSDLDRANNLVRSMLGERTLYQLRERLADELASERARLDQQMRLALMLGTQALARVDLDEPEVVVEGQAQLIGRPEFADIDRARLALRTLEDKERLAQLLDRTLAAPGIQVLIGSEDAATGAGELALVAAPFAGGSLAVIGPTRMDYSSIVPTVRYTAALLGRLMGRDGGDT